MRILCPYNEILPRKKAHDVFIFQECAALASSGIKTSLLCGKGSRNDALLFQHYGIELDNALQVHKLPIVRKNNWLNLSWNAPFFYFSQRKIEHEKPDWVILSVQKQGEYHLKRKVKGVRYLYEVHEINEQMQPMLENADLVLTTTEALKKKLQSPPYALKAPIETVPLAVNQTALPSTSYQDPFQLMYVGQLYQGQGIELLCKAMEPLQHIHLKIIGGRQSEIDVLSKTAPDNVQFLGFKPPAELPKLAAQAHAFIAPFEPTGRMPYVAHTKLYEYAVWGRPFIAPDLPVVREHFTHEKGVLLFKPGDLSSLTTCIQQLSNPNIWNELQNHISTYSHTFTWQRRIGRIHELLGFYQ